MIQNKHITRRFRLCLSFVALFILVNCLEASAQHLGKLIETNHRVFVPNGNGPFPVAIVIPGCSGVSLHGLETDTGRPGNEDDKLFRRHWPVMAGRLQKAGYLVLIVDYLASENVVNTCSGEIPYQRVSEYINESISFAKRITNADSSRINIIGASYGGASVLTWLANLDKNQIGVRSAITLYPGCSSVQIWDSSLPLLMILGEADDIAPPSICNTLIKSLPQQSNLRVISYPEARHGFDLTEGPTVLSIGSGKTVGRNNQAGNDAWKEIISFLNEN